MTAFQSAKRICAVSKLGHAHAANVPVVFQSAKRICAVSKDQVERSGDEQDGGFNPPSGFVLFRRTSTAALPSASGRFNPPSGFVLFRSNERIQAIDGHVGFQSAKRICAVSKPARSHFSRQQKSFNPPSGFVLFRSGWVIRTPQDSHSFNPPSGFVLFRSFIRTPP